MVAASTLATPALADDTHDLKPRHGGAVVESKHIVYELVAQPTAVKLYLRDHGKPVDVSQASAKLTLLSGTQKQDVELKPARDHLAASGSFAVAAGTKAVAVVTQGGKNLGTARFALK
ncbi:MAG: hypothetical protein EOO29_02110 [Comamonadaceae bacterium]|nr:MAG: hypothetical protein EOO29_02110 [Comamonadaceae bacterium]